MTPSHIRVSRGTTRRRTSALSVGSLPADSRAVWRSSLITRPISCTQNDSAVSSEGLKRLVTVKVPVAGSSLPASSFSAASLRLSLMRPASAEAIRRRSVQSSRMPGASSGPITRASTALIAPLANMRPASKRPSDPDQRPLSSRGSPWTIAAQPAMAGMRCASKSLRDPMAILSCSTAAL